jgi:ABC-type transporter Mla subunit MlaD
MDERAGRTAYFAVGLLTIAVVLAAAGAIGFLLAKESPLERTYPIHVRFDDVSGLKLGAAVVLQGAYIGRVDAIRLGNPAPPRFPHPAWEVELALRADFPELRERLTSASRFTIQSESVFGNKYIYATFGEQGAPLAPGAVVAGEVGAGIDARTFEKLSAALDNLSGAAGELRSVLAAPAEAPAGATATAAAATAPNLRSMLANLDRTLTNTAQASDVLKEAVSEENQAKIRKTFDDLSKSAENLANVTERTKQGMDSWAETLEKMRFWKGWFGGGKKPSQ